MSIPREQSVAGSCRTNINPVRPCCLVPVARFGLTNPNRECGGFVNPPRAISGRELQNKHKPGSALLPGSCCSVRIDKSEP
ncbi:hypothetical protein QUF80_13365 [Desulfococcaceae bacterium HSG8]|nr:hypothetical protein [Desulfococcaceae bacterium HSG8]